ncbi:MAG: ribosomal RNA small subunit methyltransferase A [Chloroflexi bacterium]|nr:ribosomal RNA small subunit methyltransferase A [Chloroflexota bacterium]
MRPQKKFGQHFLTDPRILESIVNAADITSTDTVLEIGPGLGHLTRVLARRAGRLIAVEVDRALAAKLTTEFASASNVSIIQGNFLNEESAGWIRRHSNQIAGAGKRSPAPLSMPFKVVANLPYYITSAILQHLLENEPRPQVIVVMVQREVAQRIVARPPSMSLLAVSVQLFGQPRIVRTIAAGAFYPPPKVDSAVVRLDVFEQTRLKADQLPRFFQIVRAGFSGKRKQLRNSLAHGLSINAESISTALLNAKIQPSRRAETLTLDEWLALFHTLSILPIVGTKKSG